YPRSNRLCSRLEGPQLGCTRLLGEFLCLYDGSARPFRCQQIGTSGAICMEVLGPEIRSQGQRGPRPVRIRSSLMKGVCLSIRLLVAAASALMFASRSARVMTRAEFHSIL